MAFVSVDETVGSRKALKTSTEDGLKTSYQRVFQVITDDVLTDLNSIQGIAGSSSPGPDIIPPIGSPYPSDPTAFVNSIDPQEVDGYLQYFVMINYENPPLGEDETDPTARDWEFSTDTIEFEFIPETDLETNDPIRNSAGEIYDPTLVETDYYDVIRLTKIFDTWDLQEGFDRKNRINEIEFTLLGKIFPVHSLLATRWVTPGKMERSDGDFYTLNAEFIFREDVKLISDTAIVFRPGWLRHVVDRGFNEVKDGKLIPILDGGEKKATTVPKLLKDGAARPETEYEPIYITYRTKKEDDMSLWGLPTVIP